MLRGASALDNDRNEGLAKRQILGFRTNEKILRYVNGAELARYSQQGVVTPDHTIRTKNWPLIVPAPEADKLGEWEKDVRAAVDAFVARYHDYFADNNKRGEREEGTRSVAARDPGAGCRHVRIGRLRQGRGHRRRHRREHGRRHHRCRAMSSYRPITEDDLFDVEYWSLEQAKLGKAAEKRWRARWRSSPAAAPASARRRRKPWRAKARKSPCSTAIWKRRARSRNRSAAMRSVSLAT